MPPCLWPHAVLHAIEVNAEQIIFVSIDFNGETRFDMRVLWITSILLERIMLVIRGSTVIEKFNACFKLLSLGRAHQRIFAFLFFTQ